MRSRIYVALATALTGVCAAPGAVDWSYGGPGNGIAFARLFELQTGSKPRSGAAFAQAELRFSFGRASAFARTLALDFDSLHPYGYYLVKRGGDVLFAGKTAKGDSYAAADFLKRFTGYREFGGAFGRVTPPVASLTAMNLPDDFTYREEPDVPSYRLAWCVGSEAFSRCDRLTCMSTHAMDKMVTPDLYAEHPEYFPLVNGVRVQPGDVNRPWNPCMSNPDLPKLFRAYAKRFFEENPDALGIPMGVNDGGGDCNCDGCRAVFERHGNQYVEFYNLAARILAETHPGKLLAFIAYSRRCSRAPEPDFRFADNVLVEVTGSANNFDDWKACGVKHFGAYEYLYQTGFTRLAPACYTHVIADRLRELVRDYNLTTFWEESFAGTSVFDGGRQYVTDELLWNLHADVEALLADYYTSLYGPAAGAMRRFADIAEEAFRDNPERRVFFSEYCNPIQFNGYTFARIAAMDKALAEAAKLAPPDSREARRVALVSSVWGLVRLYADNWACSRALAKTDDPARIVELVERGMRDVAAIADYTIPREDVREIFVGDAEKAYAKWKNQSALAPLPPLERAADAAFARVVAAQTPAAARAWLEPLVDSPYLGAYAATQLYLLDAPEAKLVANGSFESRWNETPPDNAGDDWKPLGQVGWNWWRFPSSAAAVWTDDTEAHSGQYSVALGECAIESCLLALWGADENARYRIAFWAKRNDDNGGGKLGELNVRFKDRTGAWLDDGSAVRCPVTAAAIGAWTRYELIFTTPKSENGVAIHPMFMPPGGQTAPSTLWIDDVSLEKICDAARWQPVPAVHAVDYAYLQTDYTPTAQTEVEAVVSVDDPAKSGTLCCSRTGTSNGSAYALSYIAGRGWRFDYGNVSPDAAARGIAVAGRTTTLRCGPDGLFVDGEKLCDCPPGPCAPTQPLLLFAMYTGAGFKYPHQWANLRLYALRVREIGPDGTRTCVRDFTPCQCASGKIGVADRLTDHTFADGYDKHVLAPVWTVATVDELRAAADSINDAAQGRGADFYCGAELLLAPGVYDLCAVGQSATSHLELSPCGGAKIVGLGATPGDTVLLGGGADGGRRILKFDGSASRPAVVTNLTLMGGHAAGTGLGGAVYSSGGAVDYEVCIISNNYGGGGGGGVFNGCARACVFADNAAGSGYGGAMRVNARGEAMDCVFVGNRAEGGAGGACFNLSRITGGTFTGNRARHGGAVAGSGRTVIDGATFAGNACSAGGWGYGGAFYQIACASNCVFTANSDGDSGWGAVGHGGALVACTVTNSTAQRRLVSECAVDRCRFTGCGKTSAAPAVPFALCGNYGTNATVHPVVNSVFEQIACPDAADRLAQYRLLVNCTIYDCTAARSLWEETDALVNTIVAQCSPCDISAAALPALANCLWTAQAGEIDAAAALGSQCASPRFVVRNGWPCDIAGDSPAFNAGCETEALLELVGALDCAGRPRRRFGRIDMGALEARAKGRSSLVLWLR
ncbi:MAG: DUF4838 domain-containing protein [Kiritimatiellia bacterium]